MRFTGNKMSTKVQHSRTKNLKIQDCKDYLYQMYTNYSKYSREIRITVRMTHLNILAVSLCAEY